VVSKTEITIEFDDDRLASYTDQRLAMLWHLTQHNPADGFRDKEPGEMAMKVGWEIIRRWLGGVSPEMYHHQQHHYAWWHLTQFAKRDGEQLVPRMVPSSAEMTEALARRLEELKVWGGGHDFSGDLSRRQLARQLLDVVMPGQDAAAGEQRDPGGQP
jgi:hypothetical protein